MSQKKAVVVGASRGLGRGAAAALIAQKYEVLAIARDAAALASLPGAATLTADAVDDALAERVLREHTPDLLVLVAGAKATTKPLHELTWDEYQHNWNVDAKLAFIWLGHALRLPMKPGSHIVVVSSGAAIQGSPVSGGYAAAKRAQWLMASYAAAESERGKLGVTVHCVLPNLNPSTELGRAGIAAYAKRNGVTDEEFARRFLPYVTPEIFGAAIVDLDAQREKWNGLAYRLTGEGLVAV